MFPVLCSRFAGMELHSKKRNLQLREILETFEVIF